MSTTTVKQLTLDEFMMKCGATPAVFSRKKVKPITRYQKTYAQKVNKKYETHTDTYCNLTDRIIWINNKNPYFFKSVKHTFEVEFPNRYPQYKTFSDMYPDMVGCGAGPMMKLGDLSINTIIQRDPDIAWLGKVIANFDPFYVNPVKVYMDNISGQDTPIVWDGQHTAIITLLLAICGFKLSIEEALECQVPVSLYPGDNVAKIRERFIGLNDGTMSKPLDKVDLYMQYVYAVRHNGSTDPWHQRMEQIQQLMEKYDCFFTHEKFNDHDMPGAINSPSEIFPAHRDLGIWPVEVIGQVLEYHKLARSTMPVEPLEIDNLCHIFRAARKQGITVDTKYIKDFVKYLEQITGNSWHTDTTKKKDKHALVMQSYNKWLARQSNPDAFPKRCNQSLVAPSWICAALVRAGFPHAVPGFTGTMKFDWQDEDFQ